VPAPPGSIRRDIAGLIDWVNNYCDTHHRAGASPPDLNGGAITGRRLRTLAWHIARKPRGLVAAAIQYGHLRVQMTLGYAGTYASGFPDELAFEDMLARLDELANAHDRLAQGRADYRHYVYRSPPFSLFSCAAI
jgi:hypothetical protein